MITGAILGALIFGGIGLVFASLEDDLGKIAAVVVGSAMAGAGVFGGAGAIADFNNEPCPEGTVKVDPDNDLYEGCIPVEVAKKQVENEH